LERGDARVCIYCGQEKAFLNTGRKLKDGSKVYADERGQRWAGRRCPECERARVYAAVRCDGFERDVIVKRLAEDGYHVRSRTLPLKVEKNGETFAVAIKRAYTDGGRIVLETPLESGDELVALVFESVRIVPASQLAKMSSSLGVHAAAAAAPKAEGEAEAAASSAAPTDAASSDTAAMPSEPQATPLLD
jgi:hypothetical protein